MDQVTQLSILKKFEVEQADIDRVRAVGPMLMLEINDHLASVGLYGLTGHHSCC